MGIQNHDIKWFNEATGVTTDPKTKQLTRSDLNNMAEVPTGIPGGKQEAHANANSFLKLMMYLTTSTDITDDSIYSVATYRPADGFFTGAFGSWTSANIKERSKASNDQERIWKLIATAIANRYYAGINQKAIPANKGALRFAPVGLPPLGIGSGYECLASFDTQNLNKIKESILKWLEATYNQCHKAAENASKKLKPLPTRDGASTSTSTRGAISVSDIPRAPAASFRGDLRSSTKFNITTEIETTKQLFEKIAESFGKAWKGMKFFIEVPCPPTLIPNTPDAFGNTPEYFEFLEPQINNGSVDSSGKRVGTAGFVNGPYLRDIDLKETGNSVTVGSKSQPEFEEDLGPIDKNEFKLDSEVFFKTPLGGESIGYTDLPVNGGKEIKQPIYEKPGGGVDIDPETNEPIIQYEKPFNPKIYGWAKYGNRYKNNTFASLQGGGQDEKNDNFGKPVSNPLYGFPEMEESIPWRYIKDNSGQEIFPLKTNWITNAGRISKYPGGSYDEPVSSQLPKILQRSTVGGASPASFFGGSVDPFAPSNLPYSFSDPRSWGEYIEYTGTGKDADGKPLKWKFIYPDPASFKSAISQPTTELNAGDPLITREYAVPKYGDPTLPKMNKAYWGFRIAEITDKKGNPIDFGDLKSVKLPGGGGFQNVTAFNAGPVPPIDVKEKGTGDYKIKITYKSAGPGSLLYNAESRNNQTPWGDRYASALPGGTPASSIKGKQTALKKDEYNKFGNELYKALDAWHKKLKGEAGGGMTFSDATKQILPPYAPPPLKPPLPNSKKAKW